MRTIKFRGKRVDTGEWVYGYYSELWCGGSVEARTQYLIRNILGNSWEVTPESVGQFVGLLDRTGSDVYEGDIVWTQGKFRFKGEVRWATYADVAGGWEVWNLETCRVSLLNLRCKVIGNMYDNPGMLKPLKKKK